MNYLHYIIRLIKEIKNPPLFLYHIHHYINILLNPSIATIIACRNKKQYMHQNVDDIFVKTTDGSNQIVHPDMDFYKDGVAFICTPYPYAMEEYENPCLYIGKNIKTLIQTLCPLDIQSLHTQGVHMSDPCIVSYKDNLLCVYRETIFKDDYIYIKEVSTIDGAPHTSNRKLLIFSQNEFVLSPAVLVQDHYLLMYHVKTNKHTSKMVLNRFCIDTYEHKDTLPIVIEREPEGFYLWHIGISANNYSKCIEKEAGLKGLFLYINKNDNTHLKLYVSESKNLQYWIVVSEVRIPENLKKIIKFPYKSCFNPQDGRILLSFRDNRDRNRLILI